MAVKTSTHEQLSMVESELDYEDNKKLSDIEPGSEDSEKGLNIADCIDDGNVFPSTLADTPFESCTEEKSWILEADFVSKDTENVSDIKQYESEDTKKGECGNMVDCVENGNELPSTWVDMAIVGVEENLLTISLVIVNLVDGEWSVEVGKGDFSIVRHIIQGSTDSALVAKVGEHLHWPISKDVCAFKLDKLRYLFLIPTPGVEAFEIVKDTVILSDVTPAEVLNYVVSFQKKSESFSLDLLDKLLDQHAQFTDSSRDIDSPGSEVEGYNSMLANAIAAGAEKLVKGLCFLISAYSSQLEKGGKFLMDRMEAKCQPSNVTKSSEINPDRLMRTIERIKKLSKATEKISENVLIEIYNLTTRVVSYLVSRTANQSNADQKSFRTLPVEMLIVLWHSLNKIAEAVEVAGKDALINTSAVAIDIVRHRFGEKVGGVTEETLAVAGHAMATAYNLYKVINLVSMGVNYLPKLLGGRRKGRAYSM